MEQPPSAASHSPSSVAIDVVNPPSSLSRVDSWDIFGEDSLFEDQSDDLGEFRARCGGGGSFKCSTC